MKKLSVLLAASLALVSPALADPQSDYLAQAVSTMQASNRLCGFGLSDQAILAASVQLGGRPDDPAFVEAVRRQRAQFDANLAHLPADMVPDMCAQSRELLTTIGL